MSEQDDLTTEKQTWLRDIQSVMAELDLKTD
jgi:hypothetical protein